MSGYEAKRASRDLARFFRGTNPEDLHPADRLHLCAAMINHMFPGSRLEERLYEQHVTVPEACMEWEAAHGGEKEVLSTEGEAPASPSTKLVDWWNGRTDWIWEQMRSGDRGAFFKWEQLVWQELSMWEKIGKKVSPSELDFMSNRRGFSQVQRDFLIEGLKVIDLWDEED